MELRLVGGRQTPLLLQARGVRTNGRDSLLAFPSPSHMVVLPAVIRLSRALARDLPFSRCNPSFFSAQRFPPLLRFSPPGSKVENAFSGIFFFFFPNHPGTIFGYQYPFRSPSGLLFNFPEDFSGPFFDLQDFFTTDPRGDKFEPLKSSLFTEVFFLPEWPPAISPS